MTPVLQDALSKLSVRVVELIVVGLLIFGFVEWKQHARDAADAKKTAEEAKAIAAAATKQGATPVQQVSASEIEARVKGQMSLQMTQFMAAMLAAGARPKEAASAQTTFSDKSQGDTMTVAGAPCPSHVFDVPARRFDFDMTKQPPELTRLQRFLAHLDMAETHDGKQKFSKFELLELDPRTGTQLAGVGITTDLKVDVTPDLTGAPGPWHLRWIAALDARPSVGGGVQVNPYRNLTLGLIGLYKGAKPTEGDVALHLGWRLRFLPAFDSTIAIGPWAGVSLPSGKFKGGLAATIELTR